MKKLLPLFVTSLVWLGSFYLLSQNYISEWPFVSLISIGVMIYVVMYKIDHIIRIGTKSISAEFARLEIAVEYTMVQRMRNKFANRFMDDETNALLSRIDDLVVDAVSESTQYSKFKAVVNLLHQIDQIGSIRNDDPERKQKLEKIDNLNKKIRSELQVIIGQLEGR